jgi:sialate O-acetylesterase
MRRATVLAAAALALPLAGAALQLHSVFNDGVVLQKGAACVYGTGAVGGDVELSWSAAAGGAGAGGTARAPPAPDGAWRVCLPRATPYGGPHTLTVAQLAQPRTPAATAAPNVTLRDVLVGDVWLASGQSNMQFHTERVRARARRTPR